MKNLVYLAIDTNPDHVEVFSSERKRDAFIKYWNKHGFYYTGKVREVNRRSPKLPTIPPSNRLN